MTFVVSTSKKKMLHHGHRSHIIVSPLYGEEACLVNVVNHSKEGCNIEGRQHGAWYCAPRKSPKNSVCDHSGSHPKHGSMLIHISPMGKRFQNELTEIQVAESFCWGFILMYGSFPLFFNGKAMKKNLASGVQCRGEAEGH